MFSALAIAVACLVVLCPQPSEARFPGGGGKTVGVVEEPMAGSEGSELYEGMRTRADKFTVFGYLPEYRLNGFDYEAAFQTGLTHLIYFSIEVGRDGLPTALDRLPSKEQAKQARDAADKVGGKILLGFGGNSRSDNFGYLATTPNVRRRFIKRVKELCDEYGFDGVDYNWEYPSNHAEWESWNKLIWETKEGLTVGIDKSIVTITMYNDPNHFNVIRRYGLIQNADFVHCMVYDQPHHHSTFAFSALSLRYAKEHYFNMSKFTVGVPFYARHVSNGEPKTYAELKPLLDNDVDDQVGPYYFNSKMMIGKKTSQAYDAKAGGIMIWELGQDVQPLSDGGSLMSSIHHVLKSLRAAARETLKRDLALAAERKAKREAEEKKEDL